jgi:hypothetical protein
VELGHRAEHAPERGPVEPLLVGDQDAGQVVHEHRPARLVALDAHGRVVDHRRHALEQAVLPHRDDPASVADGPRDPVPLRRDVLGDQPAAVAQRDPLERVARPAGPVERLALDDLVGESCPRPPHRYGSLCG